MLAVWLGDKGEDMGVSPDIVIVGTQPREAGTKKGWSDVKANKWEEGSGHWASLPEKPSFPEDKQETQATKVGKAHC